jgi:hypothetical protein
MLSGRARAIRLQKSTALLAAACTLPSLIATSAATAAPAAARPLALDWDAPPACPDRTRIAAQIAALLGRPPLLPPDRMLAIRGHASEAPDGTWRLELILATADGIQERRLTSRSCSEIADAAALIVALAIDPTAVALGRAPAEAPATPLRAPPRPPPPPAIEHAAAPLPAPAHDAGAAMTARIGPAVGVGLLPGVAPGATLALGARFRRLGIEATAAYFPARRAPVTGRTDAGGDLGAVTGGFQLSWWRPGRLEVGLLAAGDAVLFLGQGFGVAYRSSGYALSAAAVAGGALRFELGRRVAVRLDAGAAVLVARPRFVLDQIGTVFQPARLFGQMLLTGELRFL